MDGVYSVGSAAGEVAAGVGGIRPELAEGLNHLALRGEYFVGVANIGAVPSGDASGVLGLTSSKSSDQPPSCPEPPMIMQFEAPELIQPCL